MHMKQTLLCLLLFWLRNTLLNTKQGKTPSFPTPKTIRFWPTAITDEKLKDPACVFCQDSPATVSPTQLSHTKHIPLHLCGEYQLHSLEATQSCTIPWWRIWMKSHERNTWVFLPSSVCLIPLASTLETEHDKSYHPEGFVRKCLNMSLWVFAFLCVMKIPRIRKTESGHPRYNI